MSILFARTFSGLRGGQCKRAWYDVKAHPHYASPPSLTEFPLLYSSFLWVPQKQPSPFLTSPTSNGRSVGQDRHPLEPTTAPGLGINSPPHLVAEYPGGQRPLCSVRWLSHCTGLDQTRTKQAGRPLFNFPSAFTPGSSEKA